MVGAVRPWTPGTSLGLSRPVRPHAAAGLRLRFWSGLPPEAGSVPARRVPSCFTFPRAASTGSGFPGKYRKSAAALGQRQPPARSLASGLPGLASARGMEGEGGRPAETRRWLSPGVPGQKTPEPPACRHSCLFFETQLRLVGLWSPGSQEALCARVTARGGPSTAPLLFFLPQLPTMRLNLQP